MIFIILGAVAIIATWIFVLNDCFTLGVWWEGVFLGALLNVLFAVLLGAILGATTLFYAYETEEKESPLATLQDDFRTEGGRFLLSGYINEEPSYSFYRQTSSGGYRLETVDADGIEVFENEGNEAVVVERCYVPESKLTFWGAKKSPDTCEITSFKVPRGSIVRKVHLDAEG